MNQFSVRGAPLGTSRRPSHGQRPRNLSEPLKPVALSPRLQLNRSHRGPIHMSPANRFLNSPLFSSFGSDLCVWETQTNPRQIGGHILYMGMRSEHKLFFSNSSGAPGISRPKSWDIPPKSLVSLGFEGHTELFGPTLSRGRPPPHPKISRPKSLRLGCFSSLTWGF